MSTNTYIFTIVDTESQKTKEIHSSATTVAELKRDLRQNGFNVDGKTIQEGLTRTEFKDDSSLLPHDVPTRNGGITNDLVFRLTKTNKNVASGMDRKEAYAEIKRLNLGEAIKAKYGRNFTQCSTNDLISFVQSHTGGAKPADKPVESPAPAKKEDSNKECNCQVLAGRFNKLCEILVENDVLSEEDVKDILGAEASDVVVNTDTARYSQSQIDAMFGGM